MKTKIILILLTLALNCNAQRFEKTTFRPAPKFGEITALSGMALIATSSMSLLSQNDKLNEKLLGVGILFCFVGVTIDLNTRNSKYKYKYKVKLFATADKLSIKLNF